MPPATRSVPPRAAGAWVPPVTHFRSTVIHSSIRALDDRGYGARYRALLAPEHKEAVLGASAWGAWLPLPVAIAHYEACDALDLGPAEMVDIGRGNERRRRESFFSVMLLRAVRGGAWASLRALPRVWTHVARGGALRVGELGPRDATVEVLGLPIAHIRYVRYAMRGIVTRAVGLFAEHTVAVDVAEGCTETTLAYRVRWGADGSRNE